MRLLRLRLRLEGRDRGHNDSGRCVSDGRRWSQLRNWFLLEFGFRNMPRLGLVFVRRRVKVFDVPQVEVEVVVFQDVVDQMIVVQ